MGWGQPNGCSETGHGPTHMWLRLHDRTGSLSPWKWRCPASPPGPAQIIGGSLGLGLALARKCLERGWSVVGTVRGTKRLATACAECATCPPPRSVPPRENDGEGPC